MGLNQLSSSTKHVTWYFKFIDNMVMTDDDVNVTAVYAGTDDINNNNDNCNNIVNCNNNVFIMN